MGITFGIGTGITATIARAIGEEDKEKALLFPDERLATDGKAGVTKEEPSCFWSTWLISST